LIRKKMMMYQNLFQCMN